PSRARRCAAACRASSAATSTSRPCVRSGPSFIATRETGSRAAALSWSARTARWRSWPTPRTCTAAATRRRPPSVSRPSPRPTSVSAAVPSSTSVRHFSVVTETYPPEVNGVALTVARLVSGLRAHGHTVSVIQSGRHGHGGGRGRDVTAVRGLQLPGGHEWQLGFPAGRLLHACWSRRRPHAIYVATEGPLGYSAVRTARRLGIPVVSGFHTNF